MRVIRFQRAGLIPALFVIPKINRAVIRFAQREQDEVAAPVRTDRQAIIRENAFVANRLVLRQQIVFIVGIKGRAIDERTLVPFAGLGEPRNSLEGKGVLFLVKGTAVALLEKIAVIVRQRTREMLFKRVKQLFRDRRADVGNGIMLELQ